MIEIDDKWKFRFEKKSEANKRQRNEAFAKAEEEIKGIFIKEIILFWINIKGELQARKEAIRQGMD